MFAILCIGMASLLLCFVFLILSKYTEEGHKELSEWFTLGAFVTLMASGGAFCLVVLTSLINIWSG